MLDTAAESHSLWRVRNALGGLHDALASDNYALEVVGLQDHRLAITIRALDGACEECLIAPEVISSLIRTQVPSDLHHCVIDLKLDVPADWRAAA